MSPHHDQHAACIHCVIRLCTMHNCFTQIGGTIVTPKLVASVGAVRMQNLADVGGMGHLVVSCLDVFA